MRVGEGGVGGREGEGAVHTFRGHHCHHPVLRVHFNAVLCEVLNNQADCCAPKQQHDQVLDSCSHKPHTVCHRVMSYRTVIIIL